MKGLNEVWAVSEMCIRFPTVMSSIIALSFNKVLVLVTILTTSAFRSGPQNCKLTKTRPDCDQCDRTFGHGYSMPICGPVMVHPYIDTHCNCLEPVKTGYN
jgi:transposase-like protein